MGAAGFFWRLHRRLGSPAWRGDAPSVAPGAGDRRTGIEIAVMTLAVAALYWLVSHPYSGIYHDAIVYALLAARWIDPSAYANDLFFLFGSQSQFELFTPAYGSLIRLLGLDTAARVVVLAGAALWIVSTYQLGRALWGNRPPARFVAIFCAALTVSYSPNFATFVINEGFATARVIAMPLALLGLALAVAGKRWQGLAVAGVGTVFHPLLGIWAVLLIIGERWPDRGLAILLGGGFAAIFAASQWTGISALQVMDSEWRTIVQDSSRDVFLAGPGMLSLDRAAFCLAALWIGWRLGGDRCRRLYLVAALMVAYAYLLAELCSYFLPVRLVMQAQPWRVLWLGIVLGVFALVDGAWESLQRRANGDWWVILAALLFWLYQDLAAYGLAALAVVLSLSSLAPVWARINGWISFYRLRAYGILGAIALIALPQYWVSLEIAGNAHAVAWWSAHPAAFGLLLAGGGGLTVVALAFAADRAVLRRFVIFVTIPLVVVTMVHWDARRPRVREMEERYLNTSAEAHPFSRYLRPGDVVLWLGRVQDVWFDLRAASYISGEQAIGIVFSREKTFESKRRLDRLAVASLAGDHVPSPEEEKRILAELGWRIVGGGGSTDNLRAYRAESIAEGGIPYLCMDPALDWVIADRKLPLPQVETPSARDPLRGGTYYLYACSDLRRG